MKKLSAIGLVILFISTGCYAIQVSGDVWGEWSADNNPYQVIGDLHIPQDSTLIIEPGCFIDFQGHYMLIIDTSAALHAIGTDTDSIVFTASDTAVGWLGLRFFSADSSALSYCIIEWGKTLDSDNMPYHVGAGIFADCCTLSVANCLLQHNSAWEGLGGGIYCSNSSLEINDNNIFNNHAGFGGAGIYCDGSIINILDNIISYNFSYYPLGGEFYGGGIACSNSEVFIESNMISYNFCGISAGGILIFDNSNAILFNNKILNNRAWDGGGGVICSQSEVNISFSLISFNFAQHDAGGILLVECDALMQNNTISDNESRIRGGGIYLVRNITANSINNIVWGNESTESPQIYMPGGAFDICYCNIQDTLWPGEGNISDYPRFCNPEEGDFHLAENSPCVGTGYNGADIGAFGIGCEPMSIFAEDIFAPLSITLYPNYPNPFNASTIITYALPQPGLISLDIYDLLGRKVQSLFDGIQPSGEHSLIWHAEGLSSGVYFYKLTAGEFSETKKMLLVR
jgi:hypothetical protein